MVKAAEEGKTIPMDVTHLNMICQVIRSNVWIDYLNHWRTLNRGRDNVFTLKTFMEIQDAPDLN
ncbi:MAG TPA: hypothetical protein VFY25_06950 [Anaerolineales bacterium]|nr:hypothetical protein [Anaerolineales bacterium]